LSGERVIQYGYAQVNAKQIRKLQYDWHFKNQIQLTAHAFARRHSSSS
jgi:hypothetical protein